MLKRFVFCLSSTLLFMCAVASNPMIVAHRGHHRAEGSAENSIRSLVKADSIGADRCEFDVWISADDILYVNHNADVAGVVIEQSESAELDKCLLKNGEKVPRLEAFLDTAKSLAIGLVLEVKPHKDVAREDAAIAGIMRLIDDKGLADRTEYISFSPHACEVLARESGRPVSFLSAATVDELRQMGATGADFNVGVFRKNPGLVKELQDAGFVVNVWTVDKPEDISFCIESGVDMITTNEPELVRSMLSEQ